MECGELYSGCDGLVSMNNLRVCPCDALREGVWGGEERGNVVEKKGSLSLCKTAESGDEVVRQVGADRCVVPGGEWKPVDVGCYELDAVL